MRGQDLQVERALANVEDSEAARCKYLANRRSIGYDTDSAEECSRRTRTTVEATATVHELMRGFHTLQDEGSGIYRLRTLQKWGKTHRSPRIWGEEYLLQPPEHTIQQFMHSVSSLLVHLVELKPTLNRNHPCSQYHSCSTGGTYLKHHANLRTDSLLRLRGVFGVVFATPIPTNLYHPS